MPNERPLPADVAAPSRGVVVVLFSQADCEFCAEVREHYLRPMMAERRARVAIAESRIDSDRPILGWNGRQLPQQLFAKEAGVRFAPTVAFFDGAGRSLATPIVGLSNDFFGGYLEQRLAAALGAAGRSRPSPA